MPGQHAPLDYAILLIRRKRYALAEEQLRRALAEAPDDARVHTCMALCMCDLERLLEAVEHARTAVELAPDDAWAYFALARALGLQDEDKEAEAVLNEAIRIEPEHRANLSLLAALKYDADQWEDALKLADRALAIDPDDAASMRLRADCLTRLGHVGPAESLLQDALRIDAENARTHAKLGRNCLQQEDRVRAMGHFREALRIDPHEESARLGILDTLKAANPVFRLCLRGFFWSQTFSSNHRFWLFQGLMVLLIAIVLVAWRGPLPASVSLPVIFGCSVFLMLFLYAKPLSDVTLRWHPLGRLALTRDERLAANFTSGCLLVLVPSAVGCLWFSSLTLLSLCAMAMATAGVSNGVLRLPSPRLRKWGVAVAVLIVLLCLPDLVLHFLADCRGATVVAEDSGVRRTASILRNASVISAAFWGSSRD